MPRRGVLALALLASPLAPLAAQSGLEARTSVRLFGGLALNQPLLWSIPRQPILVRGTEAAPQRGAVSLDSGAAPQHGSGGARPPRNRPYDAARCDEPLATRRRDRRHIYGLHSVRGGRVPQRRPYRH